MPQLQVLVQVVSAAYDFAREGVGRSRRKFSVNVRKGTNQLIMGQALGLARPTVDGYVSRWPLNCRLCALLGGPSGNIPFLGSSTKFCSNKHSTAAGSPD